MTLKENLERQVLITTLFCLYFATNTILQITFLDRLYVSTLSMNLSPVLAVWLHGSWGVSSEPHFHWLLAVLPAAPWGPGPPLVRSPADTLVKRPFLNCQQLQWWHPAVCYSLLPIKGRTNPPPRMKSMKLTNKMCNV